MSRPTDARRWSLGTRRTTQILVASILVWLGSIAAVMVALSLQQGSPLFVTRSDASWNAFQVSQESNKLQMLITDSILHPDRFELRPLLTRMDILIGRMAMVPGVGTIEYTGEQQRRLVAYMDQLKSLSGRLATLYDRLKTPDAYWAEHVALADLNREAQSVSQELSLLVHLASTNQKTSDREWQTELLLIIDGALAGLVASFIGLVLLYIRKARRADVAYRELLASQALIEQKTQQVRTHEQHEALLKRELDIANRARTFLDQITGALAQIGEATHSLSSTSEAMLHASGSIRDVVESTNSHFLASSDRVRRIVVATTSLTDATRDVSLSVEASRRLVETAADKTGEGHLSVKSLVSAASQIGTVAASIKGIADQTNLLALNATIEAARAGEAGRGFAVVAQEVKQLALQTSQATSQITDLISSIHSAGRGSLDLFAALEAGVQDIVTKADTVSAAIEQQFAHVHTITEIVGIAAPASERASSNYNELSAAVANIERVAGLLSDLSRSLEGRMNEIVSASTGLEVVKGAAAPAEPARLLRA